MCIRDRYREVEPRTVFGVDSNTWRLGFENVKPFKEEKFMKNSDNFKSSIRPEINSTYFNNNFKSYALSWNDVSNKLKEYEDLSLIHISGKAKYSTANASAAT